MVSQTVKVVNEQGMHMRPASLFCQTVTPFASDVKIVFNGTTYAADIINLDEGATIILAGTSSSVKPTFNINENDIIKGNLSLGTGSNNSTLNITNGQKATTAVFTQTAIRFPIFVIIKFISHTLNCNGIHTGTRASVCLENANCIRCLLYHLLTAITFRLYICYIV